MPVMGEGCTTPRKYVEFPMNLAGHQTKEADLLHDYAFADVRAHIRDEVQG